MLPFPLTVMHEFLPVKKNAFPEFLLRRIKEFLLEDGGGIPLIRHAKFKHLPKPYLPLTERQGSSDAFHPYFLVLIHPCRDDRNLPHMLTHAVSMIAASVFIPPVAM